MHQTFRDLALAEPLLRALDDIGFVHPTPIQFQAIPDLLRGTDVLGVAQTGTGKTAAFALPILQHLAPGAGQRPRRIRALVLAPTRELAAQIDESFRTLGAHVDLRSQVIFGGVNQNPQVAALRRGIDVLVATPGRLLDLHGQGHIDLGHVTHFVLDEADRMLDMGFVHDIRRVERLVPKQRQTLLFSATMPDAIAKLASDMLRNPVRVEVTPQATTVELIEQSVMFVGQSDKKLLLADLLVAPEVERAMVFTRTKHGANRLVQQLDRAGLRAAAIHGNKSQGARVRALEGFRDGDIPILVATDVASRGIDVDDVTHVFNYDLPNEPESYVHRIGRTARAGRTGVAIAFCDPSEGAYLRAIEKTIGMGIPVVDTHAYHCQAAVPAASSAGPKRNRGQRDGRDAGRAPETGGRRRGDGEARTTGQASGRPAAERPRATAEGAPRANGADRAPDDRPRRRRRHRRPGTGAGAADERRS